MYSISGLPAEVSGLSVTGFSVWPTGEGKAPVLTVWSVLTGTLVMSRVTEAGSAPEPSVLPGLDRPLTKTKTRTIAMTRPTEPPTMSSRRRCSARRAAACWAAIRSRALRVLFRVALLMVVSLCLVRHTGCGPSHWVWSVTAWSATTGGQPRRCRSIRLVGGGYCSHAGVRRSPHDQCEEYEREHVHACAVQADGVDLEQLSPDQVQHEDDPDDHRAEPGPVEGRPRRAPAPRGVDRHHEQEERQAEDGHRDCEDMRLGARRDLDAVHGRVLRAGKAGRLREVLIGQVGRVSQAEHGDHQRGERNAAARPLQDRPPGARPCDHLGVFAGRNALRRSS